MRTDTNIAIPGFAGFIPSLKYQFGQTYGNATRTVLQSDHSLKKGKIRQELLENKETKAQNSDKDKWLGKYAKASSKVDDRFSFPPIPGYTGNLLLFTH